MRLEIGDNNFVEVYADFAPIANVFDSATNDSNKSYTVPSGETWKLNWAHIFFASTATVGNRQITMRIKDDSGNEVYSIPAGSVQAASSTNHYDFAQGVYRETAFVAGEIQVPFPVDMWLTAGFVVQFLDSAAVDAAADDMTVSFQYKRYKGA